MPRSMRCRQRYGNHAQSINYRFHPCSRLCLQHTLHSYEGFCEILNTMLRRYDGLLFYKWLKYCSTKRLKSMLVKSAPGPYGHGPLIILKNVISRICSRTIFEKHTAPGTYSKHATGAVCIQIWSRPGVYLT